MGAFYGKKIIAGEMTLEQVPKYWRAKTQAWLDANAEPATTTDTATA